MPPATILLVIPVPLRKSRGWYGPSHGGTHVKRAHHEEGNDGGGGLSNSDISVRAALSQPVLDAPSLEVSGLSHDDAIIVGRAYYDSLVNAGPIKCRALGGADVLFDEHGWNYITDESYANQFGKNKNRGRNEVRLRISLLPKAVAAIGGATALEGPARNDHGTNRYPIIARFADGDVIRVILEEHQEGGHRFLSVFDLERVAKKLKRVAAPDPLRKSSHSSVQGAATDDDLFSYMIGESSTHIHHLTKSTPPALLVFFKKGHSS